MTVIVNVRRLAQPIPARGQQNLWDWEMPAGLKWEEVHAA